MRALSGRAIMSLSIFPVLACRYEPPVRLVAGVHDTVIVNSTLAQRIPVDAISRRGNAHPVDAAHFRWISGETVHISKDGSVRCPRKADVVVQASVGDVSTTFALYCRPMRDFAFGEHTIGLFVDGRPRELQIVGDGIDHRPVTLIAARLRVRDSSIAVLDGGRVVPRRPGATRIDVEAGDSRTSYFVEVLAKVNDPSRLRPHQAFVERTTLSPATPRTWRIAPGRYEIRFLPDAVGRGSIAIATTSANCSRYGDGAPHVSCVADHDTDVIAGAVSRGRAHGALAGTLVIRRLADPPQAMSYFLNVNYLTAR